MPQHGDISHDSLGRKFLWGSRGQLPHATCPTPLCSAIGKLEFRDPVQEMALELAVKLKNSVLDPSLSRILFWAPPADKQGSGPSETL